MESTRGVTEKPGGGDLIAALLECAAKEASGDTQRSIACSLLVIALHLTGRSYGE